ncbi:uroporphyrinogen-III C-methyltransferase [Litoribacter alkaliphilus]|uniref:uroporphyrinogen-III C-methyltransferase n=1 Tax=Litoribacter ruber TaxID=702568 RepID=A0AAP2CFL8_9BACT|nr:uroporphyrinogen-III C-methyltransferase [Litoribacter alkaliphilus]MBS9523696.1 uroporphyrinogen-III C-methyltransferase [Litoribacter alkaliphilus]
MRNNINPKVTLVGAGPGDPELITWKGILALSKADVILYDALVDKSLLNHAPKTAIKVYVGKRNKVKGNPQEETNHLCVYHAKKHGHVVRLKGGDPFVFGRGSEEVDYIQSFGVATEVIPGITSSVAVPAAAGIPVTKRGVSESFWVITGSTTAGKLSRDVELAAQSTATVVVLMGMGKLPEIVKLFKMSDRASTPIAIIQSGTTKEEKIVAGNIEDIEEKATLAGVGTPAIIIIGEVVRESPRLMDVYREAVYIDHH